MRIIITLFCCLLFSLQTKSQCTAGFVFSINGQTVNFIDQSTTSQGIIIAYSWNFGDPGSGPNNTSFLANPVHAYSSPGTYMVQHTISTDMGCQETVFMAVNIPPPYYDIFLCPPAASTTISSNTQGNTYQWQISPDGLIYTNLANTSVFTGTLSNQLQISNMPSSSTGLWVRCLTDGSPGTPFKLSFRNTWTGTQNNSWSNPANWSCGSLPDAYTNVVISTGSVSVDINTTVYTLTIIPPATVTVQTGVSLTVLH